MKEVRPPKGALRLLHWFIHPAYLEDIEGDLLERFSVFRQSNSAFRSHKFYWMEVIKLLRPSLMRNIEGADRLNAYGLLAHQIRISSRHLWKSKIYSFTNVLGLSLGLTVSLVIMIFVNYESNFDQSHQDSDLIHRVVQHTAMPNEELLWGTTAYPLAAALKEDFPEIQEVTQIAGPFTRTFQLADKKSSLFEENQVLFVDSAIGEFFNLNWIQGNPGTAFSELSSIILTHEVAVKYFGQDYQKSSLLGKTILLNSKDPLTITGIVEDADPRVSFKYRILVPYEFFRVNNPYFARNWSGNYSGTAFVKIDPSHAGQITTKINSWKGKYLNTEDDQKISYRLQALSDVHTNTSYESPPGGYTMPSGVLVASFFVSVFMLLVAVVNFANLSIAKSNSRIKEAGVSKVLGISRIGLFRQFMLENFILVVGSFGLALVFSFLLLEELNNHLSLIDLKLAITFSDISVIALLATSTVMLATCYPAIVISGVHPLKALNGISHSQTSSKMGGKRILSIAQFTIVQMVVISTVIVGSQMRKIEGTALGFATEAIVVSRIPTPGEEDILRDELLRSAKISNVSFGSGPPMAVEGRQLGTTYRLPDQNKLEGFSAEMKIGDVSYLEMFGLSLKAGRNFRESKSTFDEFIVNQKLIDTYGWTAEEAIGKKIQINEGVATIIGVLEDFHNNSLQYEISPVVIMNWNVFHDHLFVQLANSSGNGLAEIEETWKATFPKGVFNYNFLNESIEKEYLLENLVLKGFNLFATIIMVISCVGLFAMMSYFVIRKTKEVGIRKVLGASVKDIIHFFSREFVVILIVSFILAAPVVVIGMDKWLSEFAYSIDLSIWLVLGGGSITLLIALITSIGSTLNISLSNPVDSLRDE